MIDIATATPDQLREAMSLIATRLAQLEQEAATTEEGLRAQANLYTTPELAAASGIAHTAQLKWMLTIARTVRDLARVVSGTID